MVLDIRAPELHANPYPAFRRLRQEAPVCRVEPYGHWAVARYADVSGILRNPSTFASSGIGPEPDPGPAFLLQTRGMIGADPPAHPRLRSLINKAFTPGRVAALEGRIRAVAEELTRELRCGETIDLVRQFSMPLPVVVIAEMLGVEPQKREDFKRWSDLLLTWRKVEEIDETDRRRAGEEEIAREVQRMRCYLERIIDERRRSPREDLISALVLACEADQKLTPLEVLGFVRLLLVAGTETTTNLIGNTILALLAHPTEWERVKNDRSLIPALIEESLRYDSPVLSLIRRVVHDTEIAGVKIGRGELVLPLLASANHDEVRFTEPERFRIGRDTQGHLAFGGGIHFCLGAPLARLQARIALETIFAAFSGLERAEAGSLEYIDSFFFRGVKQLKLALPESVYV